MNNLLFFNINNLAEKNPLLDAFMVFNSELLIYVLIILTGIIIFHTHRKKKIRYLTLFVIDICSSFALYMFIQYLLPMKRPFQALPVKQLVHHVLSGSFPSGHTTIAFALGIGLFLYVSRTWGTYVLLCAALIGFARIFVGVHYPVDILGGVILAFVPSAIRFFLKK